MNGTKYTRMNQVNFFIGFLLQISLGSFLNTLFQMNLQKEKTQFTLASHCKSSVFTCCSLEEPKMKVIAKT